MSNDGERDSIGAAGHSIAFLQRIQNLVFAVTSKLEKDSVATEGTNVPLSKGDVGNGGGANRIAANPHLHFCSSGSSDRRRNERAVREATFDAPLGRSTAANQG
ncbi:hypothetical protein NMA58_25050 (plasmid) [Rhizobium sp. YTUHZ045]|uniref:hypothetical protein n=1 Tax=Rhizobium sp. YTUHZ045 TaxID=2962888 RepID=UPI003DA81073